MANVLANSVKNIPHIAAFDDMMSERFAQIDLTPLMMYVIDTAPTEALIFLAEQFHVIGLEGTYFADTEDKLRALIKKAIELHKYKGTPWSIKEALKVIGIADAQIQEGLSYTYNGSYYHGGSITYGGSVWAAFRVKIDINGLAAVDAAYASQIKGLINEYKNVRSWLVDVTFLITVNEDAEYGDDFDTGSNYNDSIARGLLYNGLGHYDGAYTYNKAEDQLLVKVIHVATGGIDYLG